MSEKHLDVGHVVVFGYEDNRMIRAAARAAGVGAIEFIRRSALAAAAPRPAEEADGLDDMIRLEPDLYAKMLRVAYHAMLAQENYASRMTELQCIMTEAAGWPEDDRVVIDVLMEQWEEENAAMARAEEQG